MRSCQHGVKGFLVAVALVALLWPAGAWAQDENEEPEEPDFFFLTGGPYTQKNSPQIIWGNQWVWTRGSEGSFVRVDIRVSALSHERIAVGQARANFRLTKLLNMH